MIAAPKQRNTEEEKKVVKEERIPEAWKAKPAKLRHRNRHARWTVKFSKAKARPDGTVPPVDRHSDVRLSEPCLDRPRT